MRCTEILHICWDTKTMVPITPQSSRHCCLQGFFFFSFWILQWQGRSFLSVALILPACPVTGWAAELFKRHKKLIRLRMNKTEATQACGFQMLSGHLLWSLQELFCSYKIPWGQLRDNSFLKYNIPFLEFFPEFLLLQYNNLLSWIPKIVLGRGYLKCVSRKSYVACWA